jgi:hypothetical protein
MTPVSDESSPLTYISKLKNKKYVTFNNDR